MKISISILDFTFMPSGFGHYNVTYTSPKTFKTWTITTSNMRLIDLTYNAECPKVKDLISLKQYCKGN